MKMKYNTREAYALNQLTKDQIRVFKINTVCLEEVGVEVANTFTQET